MIILVLIDHKQIIYPRINNENVKQFSIMNKIALLIFLFFQLVMSFNIQAQNPEVLQLDLEEIIALAQSEAPDVLLAETQLKANHWQYQSNLANFKPSINLNADIPTLNRNIEVVTLPTGRDTFLQRAQVSNFAGISLVQQIPWTGGEITAGTRLRRLDIINEDEKDNTVYFSTPFSISIRQPVFGFNELKWDKKIEPLIYQEATKEFAEEMENIAYEGAQLFFEVLIAQLNLEAALADKANADTLFKISKGRYEVGRIAETELLQIELTSMNADANAAQATLDLQTTTEELRNFLGITKAVEFVLKPPIDIPLFLIDEEQALNFASQNRSEVINFDLRLLQADRNVAIAKANSGLNMDLIGSFSYSKTEEKLADAYASPLVNNEFFSLGLQVPIADWGKARARLEQAKSFKEVEEMVVGQEKVNFEKEIILKVRQFDLVRNQVSLSLRAYDVSKKRQEITRSRYYIGKIGITELNIAVADQESARRSYMNALRSFWLALYDLRRRTLYDFERNISLVKTVENF